MAVEDHNQERRILGDYTMPSTTSCGSSIVRPTTEANNFDGANNQLTMDRSVKRGVMEVDTMDALLAQNKPMAQQLTTLNKKMEKLEVAALETQAEIQTTCGLCGGPHDNHNCSLNREDKEMA
ncbi:hypothetical protein PIB30_074418 [Stylosanthes scabra]|uniref:Uncharacterized protein n=1 Tax=Stylosanthes scabra TaxID=79078 RepID=A0ABU6VN26_9FABA|nr:hypothetical protein [Stylosanthes scabra]